MSGKKRRCLMGRSTGIYSSFGEFSADFAKRIDSCLHDFFEGKKANADYPFITDLYCELQKYCSREGKRIRPLLVLLGFWGYGGGTSLLPEIVRFSSAVELMHSMLLVQDDIIDRSPLRRGEKSLHLVFSDKYRGLTHNENLGSDIALVLADILFSNAIEIILSARVKRTVRDEFMRIFSSTYETTAFGQVLDSLNSLPCSITPMNGTPRLISTMKTAYYTVYYPLLMGYVLTGKKAAAVKESIREFALPLGMAFQVRDDILGIFGSENDIGKPSDSDIREGKLTLLIQETADSLPGDKREQFVTVFTAKQKSADDIQMIRDMVRESGALEKARKKHGELINQSEGMLCRLGLHQRALPVMQGVIDLVREID